MKHRPKYTTACQSLINACQATELIKGVSVTLTMDTPNDITRQLPRERKTK